MSNGGIFTTGHRAFASFLMFVLGDEALLDVYVDTQESRRGDAKIFYAFRDDGSCGQLHSQFHTGAGVSDAKALLECARELHFRTGHAHKKYREQIEREGE